MSNKKQASVRGNDNDAIQKIDSQQRRRLVGGTLTGVAAAVWHKPVVNAVMLPANAQASMPEMLTFFGGGEPTVASNSLLDILVPLAHAGISITTESVMASIVQNELDGDEYTVEVLLALDALNRDLGGMFEQVQISFTGILTLGVEGTLDVLGDDCLEGIVIKGPTPSLTATLNSISETEAVITTSNDFFSESTVSIPSGSGSLPSAMCIAAPLPTAFSAISFSGDNLDTNVKFDNSVDGIAKSLLDAVIPEASAGGDFVQVFDAFFSASAVLESGTMYMVTFQEENQGRRWSGLVEAGNSASLAFDNNVSCPPSSDLLGVTLGQPTVDGIQLTVPAFGVVETTLVEDGGALPAIFCAR